jgi:hypothetical protein
VVGHIQVARILRGDTVNDEHFRRFWNKCKFLAINCFKLSSACPKDLADIVDGSEEEKLHKFVLHGLLDLKGPLNMIKTAIKLQPDWARQADADGNYPLHLVVQRRPFHVKDIEVIRELLEAYPLAAGRRNRNGDLPVHIAIRGRMVFEEGLGDIVEANTDVLGVLDKQTTLYPFLLAGTLGGRAAVNTTYQLLVAKPHLVKDAIENKKG